MTGLQAVSSMAAYFVFQMGTLLLWPRRHNIVAWLALPLFVTAYVFPLTLLDHAGEVSEAAIDKLVLINGLGATAMLLGLILGRLWLEGRATSRPAAAAVPRAVLVERIVLALAVANVTMTLCFVWLGGLPIFAEDIFLAKFFKGEYKARYDQISVFYRLSQTVLVTLLPIAVALMLTGVNRRLLVLVAWSMILFAGALNRGLVLAGVIVVVAAWSTATRLRWATFVVASTLLVLGGSVVYSLLGLLGERDLSIVQEIAWGAPDVSDQLQFLEAFEASRPYTYGLTFIGGLVPGNFAYNPSVFTLAILNATEDVSEIGSGGLRLTPALYGYIALSWVGALVVPFLSGLLQAPFIARLRSAFRGDLVDKTIGIQFYFVAGSLVYAFYALGYQGVIALVVLLWLFARPRRRARARPRTIGRIDVADAGRRAS